MMTENIDDIWKHFSHIAIKEIKNTIQSRIQKLVTGAIRYVSPLMRADLM